MADVIDLLALCRLDGVSWYFIAREAQRPDGLERLLAGSSSESGPEADETLALIREGQASRDQRRRWVSETIRAAKSDGYHLTTVLDEGYPVNLRLILNLPPFLFYRGELRLDDALSVAVVGTRQPGGDGLSQARAMARRLVQEGVTVLSGLARGIDTAAHEACLESGGRTIAVLGCGIRRMYPPENALLAQHIVEHGALVSQFWPDTPPVSYNFTRRNIVTSGMGQGTVVIEASRTSGAKNQARQAFEHGKALFLVKSLVDQQGWTKRYVGRSRVYVVDGADDVVRWLRSPEEQRDRATQRLQLALSL